MKFKVGELLERSQLEQVLIEYLNTVGNFSVQACKKILRKYF